MAGNENLDQELTKNQFLSGLASRYQGLIMPANAILRELLFLHLHFVNKNGC